MSVDVAQPAIGSPILSRTIRAIIYQAIRDCVVRGFYLFIIGEPRVRSVVVTWEEKFDIFLLIFRDKNLAQFIHIRLRRVSERSVDEKTRIGRKVVCR